MNKTQHYNKRINTMNNHNNYNSYYNYGYKKPYSKNSNSKINNPNNYNEERKKNLSHYNTVNFDEPYNDYYFYPNKKNKQIRHNNNNIDENNDEEIFNNTLNGEKPKEKLLKIRININNKKLDLIIYKDYNDEDIREAIRKFCENNYLENKLYEPLFNKVNQSLKQINNINNLQLNKDQIFILDKAKLIAQYNK